MAKITINKLKKLVGNHNQKDFTDTYTTADGVESKITIHPFLSLGEVFDYVNSVCGIVTNEDTGIFIPSLEVFAKMRAALLYYSDVELPEETDEQYDVVMRCRDLVDFIIGRVDRNQYTELQSAIKEEIEFSKSKILSEEHIQLVRVAEQLGQIGDALSDIADVDQIENVGKMLESASQDKVVQAVFGNNESNVTTIERDGIE